MSSILLTNLKKEHTAIITKIYAGLRASQRLTSLGLTPGTKIQMLSSAPFQGPVQLKVRNTRLAIGRGLATKIIVSEISE